MRFIQRRRRQPPSVIIVSLIDVLLVVLIFLMVSSTFRQTPSVKLVLPESRQAEKRGVSRDRLVITVAKSPPHLYLNTRPLTFDRLQAELVQLASRDTNLAVMIEADREAPVEQFLRATDAVAGAKIRTVSVATRADTPR